MILRFSCYKAACLQPDKVWSFSADIDFTLRYYKPKILDAIVRIRDSKKCSCEIMANHGKRTVDLLLLMASTRLDMSHIQSYINSMRNIMILIIRSKNDLAK